MSRSWTRRLAAPLALLLLTLTLAACAPATLPETGEALTNDESAAQAGGAPAASPDSAPAESPAGGAEEPAGILSDFAATDLDGNAVDASLFAGYDLTMINVWGTDCGPCIQEMPDLGELAAEYQDKGVRIVGLVSDVLDADGNLSKDQVETAREIVESTGANYLHLLPSEDLFGILNQISAVPTTFFVDERGVQVGYAYMGSMSKEQWSQILDEMLEEVAP